MLNSLPFCAGRGRVRTVTGGCLLVALTAACVPGPPTQPGDPFSGPGQFTGEPRPATVEQIRVMDAQLAATVVPHPPGRDLAGLRAKIAKARNQSERQTLVHDYLHDVAGLGAEEKNTAMRQLGDALVQSRASLVRELKRTH
ncbi:MAG TPA: hypothetical protein PKA61_04950 [Nitrospira sp.]|nr:hypothetical protein [Nitrospira sp.]